MFQQWFGSSKVFITFEAPQGFLLGMNEPRVLRELVAADEILVADAAFLWPEIMLEF